MSSELGVDSTEGAVSVDRDHLAARSLTERFTRLRSAHRALPSAAADLQERSDREARAESLRAELKQFIETEEVSELEIAAARQPLDARLDEMERELLARFDLIEFVSLRATIPRSVESHRREVVALLESLLVARDGLVARLSKVEYLITMLSTEEVEGRRNIKYDPVRLTPMLEAFSVEGLDPLEADAIAGELYQIASLDADSENPVRVLRSVRSRKESIGLGCLCPNVLRAVVTYNVRMFNHVESATDRSRVSDEMLDGLFGPETRLAEMEESAKASPSPADENLQLAVLTPEVETSVFESRELSGVIDALRRRLRGMPIGSCTSERIALILDVGDLDPVESRALKADERDAQARLLAFTAVVGLLLRDMGAVESQLSELGVSTRALSGCWVRELNARLSEIVSQNLTSDYALASKLSGIKAKHLLTPMSRAKAEERESSCDPGRVDDAGIVENQESPHAIPFGSKRKRKAKPAETQSLASGFMQWASMAKERLAAPVAGMALVIVLVLTAANWMGTPKTTVGIVAADELSAISRFIASAYRSEKGHGGLLIGRVKPAFLALGDERRLDEARRLSVRLEELGVREAMLYDSRGHLHVHYVDGALRRPSATFVVANASVMR